MTRWSVLAAGASAATALSLAAMNSASAQAYIVEDAYAVAPPPVVAFAPPIYAPAPFFGAPAPFYGAPAPFYTTRRIFIAPTYVAPPVRVIVPAPYFAPGSVPGGFVETDW